MKLRWIKGPMNAASLSELTGVSVKSVAVGRLPIDEVTAADYGEEGMPPLEDSIEIELADTASPGDIERCDQVLRQRGYILRKGKGPK